MQRLLASDVIYQDSFKAPSSAELDRQGVTGTNDAGGPLVPDSNFLQSADLVTPTAMVTVLDRIRGGATTPTTGGLRGTNIVSVKVQPIGTRAEHLDPDEGDRPHEHVDRRDGRGLGRLAGGGIPVTLQIIQSGVPVIKHAKIGFINPGEQKTVSFTTSRRRTSRSRRRSRSRCSPSGRDEHEQQLGRLLRHLLRRVGLEFLERDRRLDRDRSRRGRRAGAAAVVWVLLRVRRLREGQAVLLGDGKTDLVDFAVSLQGRIDDLHRAVDEIARASCGSTGASTTRSPTSRSSATTPTRTRAATSRRRWPCSTRPAPASS